jgi:3-hydroxybutyryl-CoA dehydrogenase
MDPCRSVVACCGAGRMGRGIAHCFAYAGYTVRLLDAKPRDAGQQLDLYTEALNEIRDSLDMVVQFGGFEARATDAIMERVRMFPHDHAAHALKGAHIVFEAVPETDDAKRAALTLIGELADPQAIIASATSTCLSTQLSELCGRPERFLNAHWLNPAFLVPLVELSPTPATDRAVVEEVKVLLTSIGKVPVECAASPGYIVPRIQAAAMNEAARLVEEGVATAEDIDKAVKYGFGLRFAVLGLLEFINANMADGRNGLRDGKGAYDYATVDVPAYPHAQLAAFFRMLQQAGLVMPPASDAPSTAPPD